MTDKKAKISIIGLKGAGKSAIFQRFKTGWFSLNFPSENELIPESLILNDIIFSIWDIGGKIQPRRALWEMYTKNSAGLMYVLDISDPSRFDASRSNLRRLLKMHHLTHIPLVILANKSDLNNSTSKDLLDILGLTKKKNQKIKVFKTSAKTGEGIYEAFYWLSNAIKSMKEGRWNNVVQIANHIRENTQLWVFVKGYYCKNTSDIVFLKRFNFDPANPESFLYYPALTGLSYNIFCVLRYGNKNHAIFTFATVEKANEIYNQIYTQLRQKDIL